MNTQNIVRISTAALGTALLTVVILQSGPMEAGNEAETLAATIPIPKLEANGVTISLETRDGQVFKAGDEPSFVLTACNTSGKTKTMRVRMLMTATAPEAAMSRVLVMPSHLWQEDRDIELQPQETKEIPVFAAAKLPEGKLVTVHLQEVPKTDNPQSPQLAEMFPVGIVAMNFSTAQP